MRKFRTAIAKIIEPEGKPSVASIIYHIIMGIIILLSCAAVFVDVWLNTPQITEFLHTFELVTVCIFAFECLLKVFVADIIYPDKGFIKSRIAYLTSFDFFVDFICIISIFLNQVPSAFGTIKFIKLVKLTRLVKLNDINDGEEKEGKVSKLEKIKKRLHEIMSDDKKGDLLSKLYDIFAIVIIVASVLIIVAETFVKENTPAYTVLFTFEVVFTCFFVVEYILRVWTAEYEYPETDKEHAKTKYIFSFMALMDVLAILPFFLMALPGQNPMESLGHSVAIVKIFKILRIARVLKFSRYISAFSLFGISIKKKAKQIIFSIIVIAVLIFIWSILLYSFEKDNNPETIKNGFSGILYACQIIVGSDSFFDTSLMNELTPLGNAMVVCMMLSGGCMIGVPLGIISGEFGKMVEMSHEEPKEDVFEDLLENLTLEDKKAITAEYLPKILKRKEEEAEPPMEEPAQG